MSSIEKILFPLDSTEEQPEVTINGRELHSYLENQQEFWHWLKSGIDELGFVQNLDFAIVPKRTPYGGFFEYQLTLDMARELVIVEPTAKGRRARLYFIGRESCTNIPMDFDDLLRELQEMADEELTLQ